MKTVVIGLLGINLDAHRARRGDRWQGWRPTVSIVQQDDLLVDRFELLHDGARPELADQVVRDIEAVSPETQVRLHPLDVERPWDFEDVFGTLHGWATDYAFEPDDENYLIHITTGTHVMQICLFLLTESRHLPGRLLQTSPAKDDPTGAISIIDLDLSRYDQIAARFKEERWEALAALKSGIDTKNAAFNRQIDLIERVAIASKDPILLMGPTGSGKSSLARRIHELRARRGLVGGALVDVNCATLRGDAAMSTLFGHEKGAFTGAAASRPGLLRAANGGVLFLDEIGELGSDEQAMLLRALEDGLFRPMGTDADVASDFQLIAGTNRDLRAAVAEGRFREDLLARIDLWTFTLPALRDRMEDLEPNLDYELDLYARKSGRRITFSREARERYLAFAIGPDATWSGNFRDLNASVTRMATLAPGGRITLETTSDEIARLRAAWRTGTPDDNLALLTEVLEDPASLDLFDRVQLAEVIRQCRRARTLSEAGRRLFSASRARKTTTNDADRLRKYLARFGLDWATTRDTLGGSSTELGR